MVLTPMRRPLESRRGPPLLPGLMAASVWMTSRILRCAMPWISLFTLLTTPAACVHTRSRLCDTSRHYQPAARRVMPQRWHQGLLKG